MGHVIISFVRKQSSGRITIYGRQLVFLLRRKERVEGLQYLRVAGFQFDAFVIFEAT